MADIMEVQQLYGGSVGSVDSLNGNVDTTYQDSATFTPHVSAEGVLSWTNDKGYPNPDPVDLTGPIGPIGATGNGIASITKTGSSGLVDTYTITYTNGDTTTFNVTNGEDGEVTQAQFDYLKKKNTTLENAGLKVSGEGTEIELEDTVDGVPLKFEMEGNTSQITTTGKNLFNKSVDALNVWSTSATITEIENGIRIISSTTGNTIARIYKLDDLTNYVGKIVRMKCNFLASSNNYGRYTFGLINSDGSLRENIAFSNNSNTEINFKVPELTDKIYLGVWFYANTNGTIVAGDYIDYTNIIITIDNEDMTYEPYTGGIAGPNPDYPQDIHVVTGDNSINVQSKNLLNKENIAPTVSGNYSVEQTLTGIKVTRLKTYSSYYPQIILNLKPNTTYTYKQTIGNKTDTSPNVRIFLDDTLLQAVVSGRCTFTTSATGVVRLAYGDGIFTTNGGYAYYEDIQMEEGPSATDYVPHQAQSFPLTLGDLEVCSIGDYKDFFFKNTIDSKYYDSTLSLGKWYLKKNIKKIIFDGTENWYTQTSYNTTDYYCYRVPLANVLQPIGENTQVASLCNQLIQRTWYRIYNQKRNELGYAIRNDQSYLYIKVEQSTLAELTSWLTSNNLILYAVSTTPENILLNDTLQTQLDNILYNLPTYAEKTYITQENDDLPFIINAIYFTNTINGNYAATLDQLNDIYLKLNEINSDIGNISSTLDEINGEEV